MATGITKSHWSDETPIISDEEFSSDFNFEIKYEDKTSYSSIINKNPENQYDLVIDSDCDNEIYYGDNYDVLSHLIKNKSLNGKVKLVYIDPPYGTNSIFQSRHQKHSYKDDLIGSHFLEFIRKRIILLRELISADGSIYMHLDNNMVFEIKVIMDEVFGAKNFRGLITRKKCSNKNSTKKTFGNISDYILFYSKSDTYTWHRPADTWTDEKILKEYPCVDEATGRRFKKVPIHAPGIRNGETGKKWKNLEPPPGKHWQYTPKKLDELDSKGEIYWSSNGNPRRKVFLDEDKGIPIQDIWLDLQDSLNQNVKSTGYPTEKNPKLLERIIQASSNEGDLVIDCFAGSGTTLDVADRFNRKWIGIDNSAESIISILKRFYKGHEVFGDYVSKNDSANIHKSQTKLFEPKTSYKSQLDNRKVFKLISDNRYSSYIRTRLEAEFIL